jgi:hypothetical protein
MPDSQDTGPVVLVVAPSRAEVPRGGKANFSVKEKDETRPFRVCGWEPLNTFILVLPEFEGFLFSIVRPVSNPEATHRHCQAKPPPTPHWSLS